MTRSLALLLCVLAAGCNYDPETRLFRAMAPRPEDVALAPPGVDEGAASDEEPLEEPTPCTDDTLRCHAQNIAGGLNFLTVFMLTIVDHVVQLPPSHREAGRRVWGPHFDRDSGNTFRFEMSRDEGGGFAWCLHVAPGDIHTADMSALRCEDADHESGMMRLMSGVIDEMGDVDGEEARSGSGVMLLEALRLYEVEENPELVGTFNIEYDNTGGAQDIEMAISDAPQDNGRPPADAHYHYTRDVDGGGTFRFQMLADITGPDPFGFDSAPEEMKITARWLPDRSGRADARVCGGDLAGCGTDEEPQYYATHCWDGALVTTFFDDADPEHPDEGDVATCVFDAPLPEEG